MTASILEEGGTFFAVPDSFRLWIILLTSSCRTGRSTSSRSLNVLKDVAFFR